MKIIVYPVLAAAVTLAASWYILTPLLLLYGQYWSWCNILFAEDRGILTRLAQCLAWDVASFVVGAMWVASVAVFAIGEKE